MGLCYSKAGWLATGTDTYTDCSGLSTSNCKSLVYESPRWSSETGDKGKLGTLFYKRWRRRRQLVGHPDLFSARLEGLLGGIHTFQMKQYCNTPVDVAFASFVGTPFVRSLEMQGMDALARSYAISAAKASARNTFLLLQERDKSETVEVLSPMIKIQTPDRSSSDGVANEINIVEQDDDDEGDDDDDVDDEPELLYDEVLELENIQGGVLLDSPADDDEIGPVLEPDSSTSQEREDSRSSEFSDLGGGQDIDLGAPYKAGIMQRVEPRSFFESCFPATGRWASVVNAARHSACLPRVHNSPAAVRHKCTEVSDPLALDECLELEIRHEYHHSSREMLESRFLRRPDAGSQVQNHRHFVVEGGGVSGSESTCSEAGHACVGCCGSRASDRYSDSENCSSSENGHACVGCCGSREDAIAASLDSSRSVKSETGSTSDLIIRLPQRQVDAAAASLVPDSSSHESPTLNSSSPPILNEGMEDKLEEACAMSTTPAHGLRVVTSNQGDEADSFCTSVCISSSNTTSQRQLVVEQLQPLERVDSDLDAFFSFPSSPSAKVLGERGSGHIIEEMKSAKLMEDMGLRRILDEEQTDDDDEELLEGPRSRAESPRGGNALSKGAFGSPFPVLAASGRKTTTTRPILDKKLKLFSLERANTAALAKKHGTSTTSDGALTSSSDPYLDSSSSNLSRPPDTTHDWDDYSSDLFEIQDMQPMILKSFPGVTLSCLPIKKSLGCTHEACDSFSDVESAPSCNSSALKYQVRGANAMRVADNRARNLREQATMKAKSEQARVSVSGPAKDTSPQGKGKGISVMVLSLLRRRPIEVKHAAAAGMSGSMTASKPSVVGGSNRPLSGKPKIPSSSAVSVSSSFEFNGKSIKALSIRDVLERQEKQDQRHTGH